jgi:hypothetical protein
VAQHIQFGFDQRTVISDDLQSHINPVVTAQDSRGASGNVRVNHSAGQLSTFNSGAGAAQNGAAGHQVQLRASDGLVQVGAYRVEPGVAETLRAQAPEMFVAPEVKAAEAQKEADNAKDAEAEREEINRYKDDAVEGVAMHIANDVDFGDQTRLLWELHSTGAVSTGTLNRVADQLRLSVSDTVDAINAISTHSSLQLAAMCGAAGVDAAAFSDWMKKDHSTEMFKAVQVATQDRDIVRAWGSHIAAFKARGGVR